ncbi:MAG: S-layer homology domain-containing protein [Oscillospiraceae bacterium]
MKKRLISLMLVLVLVLTFLPATALAADGARDTAFFTDYAHTDLNYADMEFVRLDVDAALAEMDAVRALLEDPANVETVRSSFDAVVELQLQFYDMYILAYIRSSQDVTDDTTVEDLQYAEEAITLVRDGMFLLLRDILNSPCAAAADHLGLTQEDVDYLREYEAITQEELDRQNQETTLTNAYWAAAYQVFTAEYNGQVWDDDSATTAYYSGELSYDDYITVSRAIAREENAVLGGIYMDLVALRNETAAAYGYTSYSDYAYENIYLRDYSTEEIRAFHQAVKEDIVPIYQAMETLFYAGLGHDAFWTSYDSEMIFDTMEPCLAQMSDELLEAFTYMRDHGFYDIDYSAVKSDQGYTIQFPGYNAPFFYNYPYGNVQDLLTAVHEFGHYNNYYWEEPMWYTASKGNDIAEVHSQGLELLFTHYYPALFDDGADEIETYVIYSMLSSIVQGALYDELQQYVYATENVTLQQINEEYCRLCKEYGLIDPDDTRTEMYGWVEVHHNFDSPCYYISYAVSAAGALSFWLEAQEDFYTAVDDYLAFVSLNADFSFQESFQVLGMENPLSPSYLAELSDALWTELDVEARLESMPVVGSFTDVSADDWFYEAVDFVYSYDLFSGTSDSTFEPDTPMSRGMLVTVLYRLEGEPELESADAIFTDVAPEAWYGPAVTWASQEGVVLGYEDDTFRPDAPVTREELAVMLCRYFDGVPESTGLTAAYSDADQVHDWAQEAMDWALEWGILNGYEDNTLNPQGQARRCEAAQMLLNLFSY